VHHPRGVGCESRVFDHLGSPDDLEDAPRHRLGRAGQRDELAVPATIDVARRRGVGAVAGALLDGAGQPVDRGLGPEHGENGFEQRQVDDLAARAAVARAQRRHHRECAVEAGDHVGERHRGQHRLAVREAGAGRKAAHGFDQGAETGNGA